MQPTPSRQTAPSDSTIGLSGEKKEVHDFWNAQACGEVYMQGADLKEQLRVQARERYAVEPYLHAFAKFEASAGLDVLEVGVGMGADHLELAKGNPKSLLGVDMTERAVELTAKRLELEGFTPNVRVADAEALPFDDASFDLVYSYGVLHHSPNTQKGIDEVWRVLRRGGTARIMIYNRYSLVGGMLWARYGLLKGKPSTTLAEIYAKYLESPGTKAFTPVEARRMFGRFAKVDVRPQLGLGDLLEGEVGARHKGPMLTLAKRLWPRALIKAALPKYGGALLSEAKT
jgi:ubiquinone/menaquinone biosynthesis C-methylase UbiE